MLTRGQMKRIVDRLPEAELRFLSQVMEGMLAVYKLQRQAGAAIPAGTEAARGKAVRPLSEILDEIERENQGDPMRQVMMTPIKDLLDKVSRQDDPPQPKKGKTPQPAEAPEPAPEASPEPESPAPESPVLEGRARYPDLESGFPEQAED